MAALVGFAGAPVHGADEHDGHAGHVVHAHDHAEAVAGGPSAAELRSEPHGHAHELRIGPDAAPIDWRTGEGVTFGGILFPSLHVAATFGGSTADSIARLASGHHDPQSEATLQSLEPGMALRWGRHLEGFANYSAFTDFDGELDGKWEEAYLALVDLPAGFELRGGLFLNRFGFQNALHNHAWGFVNQNLSNGRLLEEGELATIGGEATWNLPATAFRSSLSFSFGVVPDHDHAHDHDASGHEDAEFAGEDARFDDLVAGVSYEAIFERDHGRSHRLSASAAWGDNAFGRTSQVYGIGHEFQWKDRRGDPHGRFFRWRNELVYRNVAAESGDGHHEHEHDHAEDEDEHHGDEHEGEESSEGGRREDFDEFGLYSAIHYGFSDRLSVGLRAGWIGGINAMGLDERFRLSPNVTIGLNSQGTAMLRLQYDHDHSSDFGTEHSFWAQIGLSWGGAVHDHAH